MIALRSATVASNEDCMFCMVRFSWRIVAFLFSKALLYGAVGYKVFPINTLAAKREEDLSGNGAAA